jgi:hypothetical protein
MFTVAILPLVAVVFVWSAIGRYRGDARARVAGVAAALGGTLGVSLALPQVNGGIQFWQLLTLGAVAIVVAVLGSIYAETRIKRAGLRRE